MLLSELYRRLSVGLFSNLAIGNDGSGSLSARGEAATKVHLNTALRSLSKRFALREEMLILDLEVGRVLYNLKPEHATTRADDGGPGPFYILDTEDEPFEDRVIKVTRVYGSNGYEFTLNEADSPDSLFTPTATQLQVPINTGLTALAVNYQTFLPAVPADAVETDEFSLPEVLEDAVQIFIAAQVFSSMNGQEHLMRSEQLMQNYNAELQLVEEQDLLSISSITFQDKFKLRGFC